jgi:hypothetical protein
VAGAQAGEHLIEVDAVHAEQFGVAADAVEAVARVLDVTGAGGHDLASFTKLGRTAKMLTTIATIMTIIATGMLIREKIKADSAISALVTSKIIRPLSLFWRIARIAWTTVLMTAFVIYLFTHRPSESTQISFSEVVSTSLLISLMVANWGLTLGHVYSLIRSRPQRPDQK